MGLQRFTCPFLALLAPDRCTDRIPSHRHCGCDTEVTRSNTTFYNSKHGISTPPSPLFNFLFSYLFSIQCLYYFDTISWSRAAYVCPCATVVIRIKRTGSCVLKQLLLIYHKCTPLILFNTRATQQKHVTGSKSLCLKMLYTANPIVFLFSIFFCHITFLQERIEHSIFDHELKDILLLLLLFILLHWIIQNKQTL